MANALTDLRRTRRTRRLGDTEWFDLAYRVYLAAFFGGSAIIIASDQVGDAAAVGGTHRRRASRADPRSWVWSPWPRSRPGCAAERSAARSPSSRPTCSTCCSPPSAARQCCAGPLWQRVRAVAFGGALAGGVAGLLAEQRVPSSAGAWVWWGAVFGAAIGALFVAAATVVHAARIPNWLATPVGGALARHRRCGPRSTNAPAPPTASAASRCATSHASRPTCWRSLAVAVLLAVAHLVVGRLRSEHLARRGGLVSQLRFAVTMQDLRTVVLLRRQLSQERARPRPWIPVGAGRQRSRRCGRRGGAARRARDAAHAGRAASAGWRCWRRSPVSRSAPRHAARHRRSWRAAILLFVLGLDLVEPLSQEIDHPDRTLGLPRTAGWIHGGLLDRPGRRHRAVRADRGRGVRCRRSRQRRRPRSRWRCPWRCAGWSAPRSARCATSTTRCRSTPAPTSWSCRPRWPASATGSGWCGPCSCRRWGCSPCSPCASRPEAGTVVRVADRVGAVADRCAMVDRAPSRDPPPLARVRGGCGVSDGATTSIAARWPFAPTASPSRTAMPPALSPIDLEVREGDRVAIIGHNGSGKTTLLRMLAGLLDASEGDAEIAGNAPGSIAARAALSYLADQPVFYDDLSVIEHLEYIARLHGVDDWRPLADELVERVGLTGTHRRPADHVQPRPAPEGGDLPRVRAPVRGADRRRAVRRARHARPQRAARAVRRRPAARPHAARRHPRARPPSRRPIASIALRSGEVVYDGGPDTDLDDLVVG